MTTNIFKYRWVYFILVTAAIVYTAFSLYYANKKMHALELEGLSRGPIWYVTGVEFDTLRLTNTLLEYAQDRSDGNDVRTAFDILWSRLAQMRQGATREKLLGYEIDPTVYDSLMAALVANDDQVAALDAGSEDDAEALELSAVFQQFYDDLRGVSLDVVQASMTESNGLRISVLGIAGTVLQLSLVLTGSAILLFLLFAIDSVRTRRELIEKEALLDEARVAGVAKAEFISVVSHELRTPLTSISASLALLKSKTLPQTPEKTSRLVEIAEYNCLALRKLVDDLLDTEKFASGKMEFHFQTVDFSLLLKTIFEKNKSFADSFGIEMCANGIEPDVKLEVDPGRIDQLMTNLLSNAVKFSHKGGNVQISLTTETGRAVVAVKDNGRGIPKKDKPRIYDRFHQVDSSDKRERGGTGLGLSIVKVIAEAHKADLTLESEIGQGSTFYVSFPDVRKS